MGTVNIKLWEFLEWAMINATYSYSDVGHGWYNIIGEENNPLTYDELLERYIKTL